MSTPLQTIVWKLPDGSTIDVTGTHTPAPAVTPPPVTPPTEPPVEPPTTPPPATGYQPTVPANIATRLDLTKPLLDETFTNLTWGQTWAKTWFKGQQFNQQPLDAGNVKLLTGGGLSLGVSNGGKTGCMVVSNPSNGDVTPGFTFTYGYDETDALVPIGGAWPAIWTNGQNWPQDGEHDTFELLGNGQSPSTNYHSGGSGHTSTDQPQNSGMIPGTWLGVRVKYGCLRTPDLYQGQNGSGTTQRIWNGTVVRQFATWDRGAPHYLLFSIGDRNAGGNGPMIIYRRTVWNLKA